MQELCLTFNERKIVSSLMATKLDMQKYVFIINQSYDTDISANTTLQKAIIEYFGIKRSQAWKKAYFRFFEDNKENKELRLYDILIHMFQ